MRRARVSGGRCMSLMFDPQEVTQAMNGFFSESFNRKGCVSETSTKK